MVQNPTLIPNNRNKSQKIKELGIDYEFPVRREKRKVEDAEKELETKKTKVEKAPKEKTEKTGKRVASRSKRSKERHNM